MEMKPIILVRVIKNICQEETYDRIHNIEDTLPMKCKDIENINMDSIDNSLKELINPNVLPVEEWVTKGNESVLIDGTPFPKCNGKMEQEIVFVKTEYKNLPFGVARLEKDGDLHL